jgi:hypothetical protein
MKGNQMFHIRSVTLTAALLSFASAATAQDIITVDTLFDITDFSGAQQLADLPGLGGKISFREAVIAANNTPGPQTIHFAIPQAEWWGGMNIAALKLENGAFVILDDNTVIDFSTQTDYSGDTNPFGPEVGIYGLESNGWGVPAIIILASDCTIQSLGSVWLRSASIGIWSGSRNKVVGCVSLGVEIQGLGEGLSTTHNIIGGINPEEKNTLEFVDIVCWSDDNIVIGNTLTTAAVRGSRFCVRPQRNRVGGPTEAERNVISGFGGYGEEGFPFGEGVLVEWTQDTIVEGNYIGVTPDGLNAVSQRGTRGIEVRDSISTTVRSNLIAGIYVVGINHAAGQVFGAGIGVNSINADNLGVVIQNNIIGTDINGENELRTLNGILVTQFTTRNTPRNTIIGGLLPGEANTIAFATSTGIGVGRLAYETTISGNSIYNNGAIGIDLSIPSGFDQNTPNDPGDTDTNGGNHLQNYPIITEATSNTTTTTVSGTLNSASNNQYRVEIFASPAAHPSGFGEGKLFLGYTDVTTNAAGNAPYTVTASQPVPDGWVAAATATDLSLGETSEFGAAVAFDVTASCLPDLTGDGVLDFFDVAAYLDLFSAGDLAADLTNDGVLDFFDIAAFLDAFAAGCP